MSQSFRASPTVTISAGWHAGLNVAAREAASDPGREIPVPAPDSDGFRLRDPGGLRSEPAHDLGVTQTRGAPRRIGDHTARRAAPPRSATLFLMVGLPGAGKTTRARELAAEHGALRLTPDEWMIPLFGESTAGRKRDVLEGRLILVALQALRLGTSVVLDFGLWSRDERSALRRLASSAGASCRVVYLPVDAGVQRARIAYRQATAPHTTFPMTEAELDSWREQFEPPDDAELGGGDIPGPPPGWSGWPEWAADRWPGDVPDAPE